jgi:serine/threonine-protein kinase HipA
MTRRFDRTDAGERLHTQTLCAMAGLDFRQIATHDYHQLFQVALDLNLGYDALDELFRRMAFSVCMANNDDHTKNHSFLLRPQGVWELAPAYDLTHACASQSRWVSQHLMGVNGRFADITRADLLEVAQRYQVKDPVATIDRILTVAEQWPSYAQQAAIPAAARKQVAADIAICSKPLLRS